MGVSIAAAVAFFLVAGLLLYLIIMYNELVRLRNDNDRAWANIDVLLKQRRDEIPNLWRRSKATCSTSVRHWSR